MIQQHRNKSIARYSIADTVYSLIALIPKGPQKMWWADTESLLLQPAEAMTPSPTETITSSSGGH